MCWAGAAYFTYRACEDTRYAAREIFLTSLFYALAAGGWPADIPLTLVAALPFLIRARNGARIHTEEMFAFAVPMFWCFALLGYYNRWRFGSWFDFGIIHAAGWSHVPGWNDILSHAGRFLAGLGSISESSPKPDLSGNPVGVLFTFPISVLPVLLGIVLLTRRTMVVNFEETDLVFPSQVSIPLFASLTANLLFVSALRQSPWWLSWSIDVPLGVLGAFAWTFALLVTESEAGWAVLTRAIGFIVAAWSIGVGVLIALA
jgi:hypothetical protein